MGDYSDFPSIELQEGELASLTSPNSSLFDNMQGQSLRDDWNSQGVGMHFGNTMDGIENNFDPSIIDPIVKKWYEEGNRVGEMGDTGLTHSSLSSTVASDVQQETDLLSAGAFVSDKLPMPSYHSDHQQYYQNTPTFLQSDVGNSELPPSPAFLTGFGEAASLESNSYFANSSLPPSNSYPISTPSYHSSTSVISANPFPESNHSPNAFGEPLGPHLADSIPPLTSTNSSNDTLISETTYNQFGGAFPTSDYSATPVSPCSSQFTSTYSPLDASLVPSNYITGSHISAIDNSLDTSMNQGIWDSDLSGIDSTSQTASNDYQSGINGHGTNSTLNSSGDFPSLYGNLSMGKVQHESFHSNATIGSETLGIPAFSPKEMAQADAQDKEISRRLGQHRGPRVYNLKGEEKKEHERRLANRRAKEHNERKKIERSNIPIHLMTEEEKNKKLKKKYKDLQNMLSYCQSVCQQYNIVPGQGSFQPPSQFKNDA